MAFPTGHLWTFPLLEPVHSALTEIPEQAPSLLTHWLIINLASFSMAALPLETATSTLPPSEVLVVISKSGNSLKLNFSNTDSFGSGAYSGSIDFANGANILSFEPPGFGGNLDLYVTRSYFGNYSASGSGSASVPGPLPLMGVAAAFGWSRRLRRRIASNTFRL
jgi:MYXO-CTERM domain-containing protein